MVNENKLRHVVATAFKHLKSQKEDLLTVHAEIAAMRNASLNELSGGKFLPIFEKHRNGLVYRTGAAQDDLIAQFEDTIQRLDRGEIF